MKNEGQTPVWVICRARRRSSQRRWMAYVVEVKDIVEVRDIVQDVILGAFNCLHLFAALLPLVI